MTENWSTIIICVILVLVCIIAVRSYIKKLKSGCCGGGDDGVEKIRPQDADVSHYQYAWKLEIEGMTCKNCAIRIANAFHRQEDCIAEVNYRHRTAVVRSKQKLGDDDLGRIVQCAGYQVVHIELLDSATD